MKPSATRALVSDCGLREQGIIESQNGLGCKGAQCSSSSNPLLRAGSPTSSPGCPEPHPAWKVTNVEPHSVKTVDQTRRKNQFLSEPSDSRLCFTKKPGCSSARPSPDKQPAANLPQHLPLPACPRLLQRMLRRKLP